MRHEPLLECSFLIPCRRDSLLSDGDLHSKATWIWLQQQLFLQFDGATRVAGRHHGFYRDPDTGQRVDDASRRYLVAVPRNRVHELRRVLEEACLVFQQKCIYLSVAGIVEFVSRPKLT